MTSTLMWLAILAGVMLGITVLAWLLGADPLGPGNTSGKANEAIAPWRLCLMVGRWVLWALAWVQWRWIGEHFFRGDSDRAVTQRDHWQRMRPRMLGSIALVEIIIVLNTVTGG